jgi:hypothetical protein
MGFLFVQCWTFWNFGNGQGCQHPEVATEVVGVGRALLHPPHLAGDALHASRYHLRHDCDHIRPPFGDFSVNRDLSSICRQIATFPVSSANDCALSSAMRNKFYPNAFSVAITFLQPTN